MSFRVKAPIFVARQLVKHEYLPWNEVSRRYVDDAPEFFSPEDWRARAEDKKQGSGDLVHIDVSIRAYEILSKVEDVCLKAYDELLALGVAPEQARMVLPLSTMTEWIWSGSLYAFAKMCRLRLDPHAQEEARVVAELISAEAAKTYPVSWPALLEYAE